MTIWSAKDGHPMYVLAAHPSSPITQILWLEDKQQLITCAKDKRIKVWSFPRIWYDEEDLKPKLHPVVVTLQKSAEKQPQKPSQPVL